MIYTSCRYAPIELIVGLQQEHALIEPNVDDLSCAENCSHSNLCSYTKAMIETVLENHIEELVLTDCCDAVRRAYDVLKDSGKLKFIYLLSLPHKNTDREIKRFAKSLENFVQQYSDYKRVEFDEDKALVTCIQNNQEVKEIPRGDFIRLAGAHGGEYLKKEIEAIFKDVQVVDDTCSGNRHLSREVKKENFYESYARSLLNQEAPCMRMWFNGERTTVHAKPSGIIYHTIKFCDFYSFDYYHEKTNSNEKILKIETESIPQKSGQLLTRLEAFKEELGMSNQIDKIHTGYVMGIDIGSTSTDVVIMNEKKEILASSIIPTSVNNNEVIEKVKKDTCEKAGIKEKELNQIVTTGYGRETTGLLDTTSVTEITCHAKGAHYLYPEARTVIDIGGQDSKAISIDENGKVVQFVMNDKCAAGTGRFLEAQARALGLSIDEMSEKGLQYKNDITISSMCTVFAESEVISLVAQKNTKEDIIHGLNKAIASRTYSLVQRVNGKEKYILTGGVAQNKGVVKCLEEKLGTDIFVSENAQLCGAIGAALLALE